MMSQLSDCSFVKGQLLAAALVFFNDMTDVVRFFHKMPMFHKKIPFSEKFFAHLKM